MAVCDKGVKSCSAEFKMPRKANEIAVEWLESKDVGKRHHVNVKHFIGKLQEVAVGGEGVVKLSSHVNVKHLIGKLQEVAVGGEGVVKLSSQHYRATVVDLLDWAPPKRKQKAPKKKAPKEKRSMKVS